jgi:hypothetical protein
VEKDGRRTKGHYKGYEKEKEKKNETLELEVIDDEALTEAVLTRVVERLLKKS